MKIVCCSNMPFAREAFGTLGDTVIAPDNGITADHIRDADILAIRSATKVNRALIEGSRVKFVGTATIGFDHMDTACLEERGIRWCAAPGCNANSVSEYIVSALLCLARRHNLQLAGKTMGIVGVGNVGNLVLRKARALGMRTLANDPPRARAGETCEGGFVSLDTLRAESDIVTMHVPLTKAGPDRTSGMVNTDFLRKMKPGVIFINAARGGIMDTSAVLDAIRRKAVAHAVIDTWQDEPKFSRELLNAVDLGTPHIAGHSFEGKVWGTYLVYKEACRFLGKTPAWTPEPLLPPPLVPRVELDARGHDEEDVLWQLVSRIYDVREDDRRLRAADSPDPEQRGKHFSELRLNYPVRREFRFTEARVANAGAALLSKVAGLGFRQAANQP